MRKKDCCQAELHGCGDQAQRAEQKKWKDVCDAGAAWPGKFFFFFCKAC